MLKKNNCLKTFQVCEDWLIKEILRQHAEGTLDGGVPNPSLEVICQLVGKAALSITPNVQRRAFKLTGVTLAVDGSEDHEMSNDLKKLLKDHGQDVTLRPEDVASFIRNEEEVMKPTIPKIFQVLCVNAQKAKPEEFCLNPATARMQKREQR